MTAPRFDPTAELAFKLTMGEFACKCCGQGMAHIKLLLAWEKLRRQLDRAITVTSGFRCIEHNKAVGGESTSQHLYGKALDIKFNPREMALVDLIELFTAAGFRGIGRGDGWWHLDTRSSEKPKFWKYLDGGERELDHEAETAWKVSRGGPPWI